MASLPVLSWNIGDVTITRIAEFEATVPYNEARPFLKQATPDAVKPIAWLQPHFATTEGHLRMSVHALLVQTPTLRLVVDTCIGNDKPRRMSGGRPLQTKFLAEMAELGWTRESVDAVVCTHLHIDHIGWNTMLSNGQWVPTFPKAQYLIGQTEFAHWSTETEAEQQAAMADSIKPIFDAGLAKLVATDHRISPEIRLMPTLGHTPGHVSVAVESRNQRALITGDCMHHPIQIAHAEWQGAFDSDISQATRTRQQFLNDVADQDVLVIGTHFSAPTAGHVKRDGKTYRFVV